MTTAPNAILVAVQELLSTELGVAVAPETRLLDLGVSSIKLLRLIARLERLYRIEIADEAIFGCETLGDLAALIAGQTAGPVDQRPAGEGHGGGKGHEG